MGNVLSWVIMEWFPYLGGREVPTVQTRLVACLNASSHKSSLACQTFFFLGGGKKKKKRSGNYCQVFLAYDGMLSRPQIEPLTNRTHRN